ncbi:MAG TPA: M3 family metallopeptidase [Bacteroidales bacterium]|nr:M3 family metallopeptidase [Bacteroidales bacterium]
MKLLRLLLMTLILTGASAEAANPFFSAYKTPHETFPFDKVKIEHFMPAFEKGFAQQKAEIAKITANKAVPTFDNTILALEHSGALLHDVSAVFYTLNGSESNDAIMELASKIAELSARHSSEISMNAKLFARVKAVYEQRQTLNLSFDQTKLLEDTWLDFVRSGADLKGADRDKFQELTVKLSGLSEKFHQNSLKSTNAWEKLITDKKMLSGLPDGQLAAAAARAKEKGKKGYLFDLSAPSYSALLKYAENRDLRHEIYIAYNTRATSGEFDNRPVIKEMVNARRQMAALLGSDSYASYALQRRMAEKPEAVYNLLDKLAAAYMPVAKEELAAVQGFAIGKEGQNVDIQPWDWSFYSEKLKSAKFSINDEILRPYFKLENVQNGVFGLATKLYGITFKKNPAIPVWNKEVTPYEVYDKDGQYLAVLYTDFFPRASKRQGAWMSDMNEQYRLNGKDHRPQVSITMNFTKPTGDKPALLTYDEVTTFLHEFGHSLHGIFSNVNFRSQAGTNVYRDFVELPSQVMENWACEKEFLDGFAVHYQSGERLPFELVEKIKAAENYNVGTLCMRQLSFGYLDMAWNGLKTDFDGDAAAFEKQAWAKAIVLPMPSECMMSTAFDHIFAGGYAAGYYSYKWAEVLDADAYAYLTRNSIFDTETAASFRQNILSRGGTEHPMVLYKRFRGQEPGIEALLRRNGILK